MKHTDWMRVKVADLCLKLYDQQQKIQPNLLKTEYGWLVLIEWSWVTKSSCRSLVLFVEIQALALLLFLEIQAWDNDELFASS